jgi:hypothetical protein
VRMQKISPAHRVPPECSECGWPGTVTVQQTIQGDHVVLVWCCTACNAEWPIRYQQENPPQSSSLNRVTSSSSCGAHSSKGGFGTRGRAIPRFGAIVVDLALRLMKDRPPTTASIAVNNSRATSVFTT